jgi:hypothetical protein
MTAARPIAAHADMVAAIVETYRRASDADIRAGHGWYPTAGRMVGAIALSAHADPVRVAYALAALSPRNPWRWNVADCYRYAHAAASDPTGDIPSATTFRTNQRRAWDSLTGPSPDAWVGAAFKVRAFVAAIMGDPYAVVVDVWAVRVATRGAVGEVRPSQYAAVAAAYTDAAAILGAMPRDVQAVTWLVAQRDGLGSHRRGDHAATFKRDTTDDVVVLL